MCATCGCGVDDEHAPHTHVLADGRVITHIHAVAPGDHAHPHPHDHAHPHDHDHHGPSAVVDVEARVLAKNDALAARNRAWLDEREVRALNLMSSPGAGKTALLERTVRELGGAVAVVEGDQASERDADRIRATGTPVVQINTGSGCHLEADMVWHALQTLVPPVGATVFVENVGNLVCPALFDLGEAGRVVLLSTTEGEDKPVKYPHMFRAADLVLITKVDLGPHVDFDAAAARDAVRAVNPDAPILEVSAKTGEGMAAWYDWVRDRG